MNRVRCIVVGAGRVGRAILEAAGNKDRITLVDSNGERLTRCRLAYGAIDAVEGDATDEKVLRKAGAPDVDAVIVATPDDPTNLMVCALAKRMGVPTVVTRVTDEESGPLFEAVGATPVENPSHLTAEHLYHAFEVPGVRTFMPVGEDAEIVTLVMGPQSEFAGRRVLDAGFPPESLLIAVNRAGRILVPTADLTLKEGDVLTFVARTHLLDHIVGRALGQPGRRFAERLRGLFGR